VGARRTHLALAGLSLRVRRETAGTLRLVSVGPVNSYSGEN